jgi:hypothetical protein
MSGFQKALKAHVNVTSRTLHEAVNMRMAAVLMRTFLILEPHDPQSARSGIRSELTREIGERTRVLKSGKRKRYGKARQFQVKHRLVNYWQRIKGEPGLYGDAMRSASSKLQAGRQRSVGSLKALIVKMVRKVMPAFTQFGTSTKKAGGRVVKGNAMLIRLASEYGHAASNVGVSRETRVSGQPAMPGWNPVVEINASRMVKEGQEGKVDSRYQAALTRAFADETRAMVEHVRAKVLDDAKASGFTVK